MKAGGKSARTSLDDETGAAPSVAKLPIDANGGRGELRALGGGKHDEWNQGLTAQLAGALPDARSRSPQHLRVYQVCPQGAVPGPVCSRRTALRVRGVVPPNLRRPSLPCHAARTRSSAPQNVIRAICHHPCAPWWRSPTPTQERQILSGLSNPARKTRCPMRCVTRTGRNAGWDPPAKPPPRNSAR